MSNRTAFLNKFKIITSQKEKEFKSKKNTVSLFLGEDSRGNYHRWIEKVYKEKSNLEKDFNFLKILKKNGVKVPQVYCHEKNENLVIMEYIQGTILLNYIENFEKNNIKDERLKKVINILLNWLNDFYSVFYENSDYIMEDINFRNFIIRDNTIWGLDFEDCVQGRKERDIGRICAFAVSYNPPFSRWKINMVKIFLQMSLNSFDLNIMEIEKAFWEELKAIEKRRNLDLENYAGLDLF